MVVGPAEPLAANAGDDQAAVVNEPVVLDGSGSRPPAGIESYRWDFGDGSSAEGATVDHTYTTAGTYTATLTVTAGGRSETDTAVITVGQRPAQDGLVVTARDEGGTPVADAQLMVVTGSGTRHSATTDSRAGRARSRACPTAPTPSTPGGRATCRPRRRPRCAGGAGEATVTLKAGQVATASLSSTPLTLEQVVAAGIDPTDPDNQHVYEFTVNLAFEPNDSSRRPCSTASPIRRIPGVPRDRRRQGRLRPVRSNLLHRDATTSRCRSPTSTTSRSSSGS